MPTKGLTCYLQGSVPDAGLHGVKPSFLEANTRGVLVEEPQTKFGISRLGAFCLRAKQKQKTQRGKVP